MSKIREKEFVDHLTPFEGDLFEHEYLLNLVLKKTRVKKKSVRIFIEYWPRKVVHKSKNACYRT